jgi:hypothetical protein
MRKKKKNQKKEDKISAQKEQIKNAKQYLDLDLSLKSAGGLLPFKFLLDSLSQALELKDQIEESSTNKLRDLFFSINKANVDIKINNIKKTIEKPLKKDLEEAEEFFNARHKKYEERKNLHNKLADKGNKIQEERNEMIKKYEDERQNIIKESEDYVKDLQAKTDPNNPERKKLLEENEKLKGDIQNYINEGLKMKEDFDKQLKEGGFDIKNFEEKSKLDFQNTIESFQEKAQSGILLNTSLKTELLQLQQRNQELERFQRITNEQYKKLQEEIKNKANESIRISTENLEMQMRITETQNNKEELIKLIKEQQAIQKKINLMKSLNDKYKAQYEELTGEKTKKKKKKKNKKNKKNKKGTDESSTTNSTTTEHDHEHIHGHGHDHGDSDEGEEEDEHQHCCCGHHH